MRPETIKLLEEHVSGKFFDISLGDHFFFFGFDIKNKGNKKQK